MPTFVKHSMDEASSLLLVSDYHSEILPASLFEREHGVKNRARDILISIIQTVYRLMKA